jgi:uncharacterized protein (TIGR02145 family)
MKHCFTIPLLFVFVIFLITPNESKSQSGTIQIGDQVWMKNNLTVTKFANGDVIPHAKTQEEWEKAGVEEQPAWCYYQNDPESGERYGILYNYYAVNDSRGIAPNGWRVPSSEDWKDLQKYLGNKKEFCMKIKSEQTWKENVEESSPVGFNALAAGGRDLFGNFFSLGSFTAFWIGSNDGKTPAKRSVVCSDVYVGRNLNDKRNGFSVRCIKE